MSTLSHYLDVNRDDDIPKLPDILLMPNHSSDISDPEWSALNPDLCQMTKEGQMLMEVIKEKFLAAILKCLKPVPTLPDFYFYCPTVQQIKSEVCFSKYELIFLSVFNHKL